MRSNNAIQNLLLSSILRLKTPVGQKRQRFGFCSKPRSWTFCRIHQRYNAEVYVSGRLRKIKKYLQLKSKYSSSFQRSEFESKRRIRVLLRSLNRKALHSFSNLTWLYASRFKSRLQERINRFGSRVFVRCLRHVVIKTIKTFDLKSMVEQLTKKKNSRKKRRTC